MDQLREFQARTDGGRLVRVVEQRSSPDHSRGARPRLRYLLEGRHPLTQLNDGYLALPGSGLVIKLVAPIEPEWHPWMFGAATGS